ncbi:hypothetical protein QOZ91_001765 [Clostridium sardiniense]|nr:hypothetical protein [Clostridium sardiniense]
MSIGGDYSCRCIGGIIGAVVGLTNKKGYVKCLNCGRE